LGRGCMAFVSTAVTILMSSFEFDQTTWAIIKDTVSP